MMYFLISLISVAATILVTGFLYMRRLYSLSQYTEASGITDYLSFKTVSGKTIFFIIISILTPILFLGMFLSNKLTNIMNLQAIIITVVGSFVIPFIIPKIDSLFKKKLPWDIVTTQNQPKLLSPDNITNTLQKLEKIKDLKTYEKHFLQKINRSLENLIRFEIKDGSYSDSIKTIIDCLAQFNKSSIIPDIKKDFFDTTRDTLKSPLKAQDILAQLQFVSTALDAGIRLTLVLGSESNTILDGNELTINRIFQNSFKEIEKFSQEENNFQDSLLKKRQIFELYVQCLEKLINQWKRENSLEKPPNDIQSQKETIGNLAWGTNGIMNMFSRILIQIREDQIRDFKSPDQKKYYYEEFADKVIERLYDLYDSLTPFADEKENHKSAVESVVRELSPRYDPEYVKSIEQLKKLLKRLEQKSA